MKFTIIKHDDFEMVIFYVQKWVNGLCVYIRENERKRKDCLDSRVEIAIWSMKMDDDGSGARGKRMFLC